MAASAWWADAKGRCCAPRAGRGESRGARDLPAAARGGGRRACARCASTRRAGSGTCSKGGREGGARVLVGVSARRQRYAASLRCGAVRCGRGPSFRQAFSQRRRGASAASHHPHCVAAQRPRVAPRGVDEGRRPVRAQAAVHDGPRERQQRLAHDRRAENRVGARDARRLLRRRDGDGRRLRRVSLLAAGLLGEFRVAPAAERFGKPRVLGLRLLRSARSDGGGAGRGLRGRVGSVGERAMGW